MAEVWMRAADRFRVAGWRLEFVLEALTLRVGVDARRKGGVPRTHLGLRSGTACIATENGIPGRRQQRKGLEAFLSEGEV
jgi:hypothetical protein